MNLILGSIVIRCFEFDKMYIFWKEALGYEPRHEPAEGWVVLEDPKKTKPNISLDQVPNKREGKRSWADILHSYDENIQG